MPGLERRYEAKHLQQMQTGVNRLSRMLKINAEEIGRTIAVLQSKQKLDPSKYGAQIKRNKRLQNQIKDQFDQLEADLYGEINQQTADQWALANKKNNILVDSFISGTVDQKYTQLNLDALNQFQKRFQGGKQLSERIHNLTELNKQLYEDYIGTGITQGRSAASIARDLDAINTNPYNVRVFDKEGNVTTLKKISKVLQPDAKGRGIYRSPRKNLFRVTRTETNAAYRISDQTRFQQLDFVVGYEVHLSGSHNISDMCDYMQGKYPKTFQFSGWHPNCYSDDTEIMTEAGWKLFNNLSDSDKIFSLNPISKSPEYVNIVRQYKRWYNEDMIHFNNAFLSVLVTKDHDMVYQNKSDGEFRKRKAIDYSKNNGSIYRASEYEGTNIEFIKIGKYNIDFRVFSEFMGYYLSDGSIAKNRPYWCTVSQQEENDPETYAKIRKCLSKMPFKVTEANVGFHFWNKSMWKYLKQFGKAYDKFIPKEIMNSHKIQIKIFLDAFISCDGTVRQPKSFIGSRGNVFKGVTDSRVYYTASPQMMSDLGECIVKIGNRPGFKNAGGKGKKVKFKNGTYTQNYDIWRISECVSKSATAFKKDLVPYDGFVYDIELERNHIMYLRRNGKPYWGHNCFCYVTSILKTKDEFRRDVKSKNEIKQIPRSAQRYQKTVKNKQYYDWQKNNFSEDKPYKKVGGPSPGIEPYKISINPKDYKPKTKILKSAAKSVL